MSSDEKDIAEGLKLLIPYKKYRKLMAYVDLVDDEVSGFADIEFNREKNAFVMGEVYLMKQEVSGGSTSIDEKDIAEFTLQMIKMGKDQLPRMWWHSHASMGTFWSSIDKETTEALENDSFMLSLETNHNHDFLCTVVLWKPFYHKIERIPVEVMYEYERIPQYLKKEVEKKVSKFVYGKQSSFWNKKDKEREERERKAIEDYRSEKGQSEDYKRESSFSRGGSSWMPKASKEDGDITKRSGVHYLPKNKEKALARVKQYDLERVWLKSHLIWVYIDPLTDKIWLDIHGTLEDSKGVFTN